MGKNNGVCLLHFWLCKFYKSIYKAGMVPHLFRKVIANINEVNINWNNWFPLIVMILEFNECLDTINKTNSES